MEDSSLSLKARISPHVNEDSLKTDMNNDCSQCTTTGIRLLLSMKTIRKWGISKIDVKSVVLQTGPAEIDVYVRPPNDSNEKRRFFWLLQAAAYGLGNANEKWQVKSDALL